MGDSPYYKRFPSDALNGKRGLTLEQRGAYDTILDLLYDDGGEALPASERWMAGQLDCSPRKWRTIRDELAALGKIIVLPDQRITNARYLKERGKREELSRKRADAGRKGGSSTGSGDLFDASSTPENGVKSREFGSFSTPENAASETRVNSEHAPETAENRYSTQANASDLPPDTRATYSPESRVQSPDIEPHTPVHSTPGEGSSDPVPISRDQLLDATNRLARVGGVALNPARLGAFTRELDLVRGWIKDGIDLDKTAVPTIARRVASTGDETIGSLRFFDRDVRKTHARMLAAAEGTTPRSGTTTAAPPIKPLARGDADDDRVRQVRTILNGDASVAVDRVALAIRDGDEPTLVVTARSEFVRASLDLGKLRDAAMTVLGSFAVEARVQ